MKQRLLRTTALLLPAGLLLFSCSLGISCKRGGDTGFEWNLDVTLAEVYETTLGGGIVVSGAGFLAGDQMVLTNSTGTYSIALSNITANSATLSLPVNLTSGNYQFMIVRGENSRALGMAVINVAPAPEDIPDVAGMDVKGYVYSGNSGVPGVVVSDGYTVTTTDGDGIYYLDKNADAKFVFISLPGNYETAKESNIFQFFRRLDSNTTGVQRFDFQLFEAANTNHVVLASADFHMANRPNNTDLSQFRNGYLMDTNALITDYSNRGVKPYILTLGDVTWDLYWYETNFFKLPNYVSEMAETRAPVFNAMGNHDYDTRVYGGRETTDADGEAAWRDAVGPTYYSFNLGAVHYVVLDNMVYVNTGGTPSSNGDRSNVQSIAASQLEWLKADLAQITDKSTPIVVAMHQQLSSISISGMNISGNANRQADDPGAQNFFGCFSEFPDVTIFTGHSHANYVVNYADKNAPNVTEHNIGAVCGTWWWTGHYNTICHIGPDGSPGGYGVLEFTGKESTYYYKGIGFTKEKQFRTYDRNSIHITGDAFAPNATAANKALLESNYGSLYSTASSANEVLINVWGYANDWSIDVRESGVTLAVTRIDTKDPLHIIAYEARRLNVNQTPTSSFVTANTHHIFRVTASAPDTTLDITVTDSYGNIYTESMARPKAFGFDAVN